MRPLPEDCKGLHLNEANCWNPSFLVHMAFLLLSVNVTMTASEPASFFSEVCFLAILTDASRLHDAQTLPFCYFCCVRIDS